MAIRMSVRIGWIVVFNLGDPLATAFSNWQQDDARAARCFTAWLAEVDIIEHVRYPPLHVELI
jgi:hypothetical protein